MAAEPVLHPQWLSLCERLGRAPLLELPISAARAQIKFNTEIAKPSWPNVSNKLNIEMKQFEASDGVGIPVRVYTPKERRKDRAVCVYFHGGGWSVGDLDYEEATCRHLALDTGGILVVSVEMRLAPENPFPRPFLDAYEGARWAHSTYVSQRVGSPDPPFLVGGFSSGGNLAAVVTLHHLSRSQEERTSFYISGVLLSAPVVDITDPSMEGESRERCREGPVIDIQVAKGFADYYAPTPTDRSTYLISPLQAPPSILREHPPVYVITSTFDALYDQDHAYERLLSSCGVRTQIHNFEGLPHGFWLWPGVEVGFYKVYKCAIEWLLQKGS